jgi:hypothetical protein
MSLRETCRRFAPDISPSPARLSNAPPLEVAMRLNHESLGKARGVVMTIVGVLILLAFLASRLHLRGW